MDKRGINYIFTVRLREALDRSTWSQRRIASHFGVQPNTSNAWFTGKSFPGMDIVDQLADILEVSPQWLFGADDTTQDFNRLMAKGHKLLSSIETEKGLEQVVSVLETICEHESQARKAKSKAD